MTTSPASLHRTILKTAAPAATLACALIVGGLAGCASSDVVTFSKDARREGIAKYEAGQYGDASGSFRNATRQNPRDYRSHYYLGACYEQMGQHQQAIAAYKASLDTQNTTLEGREDKAFRAQTLEGFAQAVAKYDKTDTELNQIEQRAKQQSGEHYFLLAKVHRLRGDGDSAIDAYNRATLLMPKDFYVAKDYGLFLAQIGQDKPAEKQLTKAYAMKPEDAEVAAALERIGVVPGPSLLDRKDLANPPVVKGPIPPVDWSKVRGGNPQTAQHPTPTAAGSIDPVAVPAPTPGAAPSATIQSPRD